MNNYLINKNGKYWCTKAFRCVRADGGDRPRSGKQRVSRSARQRQIERADTSTMHGATHQHARSQATAIHATPPRRVRNSPPPCGPSRWWRRRYVRTYTCTYSSRRVQKGKVNRSHAPTMQFDAPPRPHAHWHRTTDHANVCMYVMHVCKYKYIYSYTYGTWEGDEKSYLVHTW
jgi:hypothetical protein